MSAKTENKDIPLSDGRWLAHRHDYQGGEYRFLLADRDVRAEAIFLTDEYLPDTLPQQSIPAAEAAKLRGDAPCHFIFHSAFCCSTLMARAYDIEGVATSLKEPMLLNDMVGYLEHGGQREHLAQIIDTGIALLSRPLQSGESVIVKPSSVVNGLASGILQLRPKSNALLMYAPLRLFLGSIARKGLLGRLWARELFVKFRKLGIANLGFSDEEHFGQTDLQIAAAGWLVQHSAFHHIAKSLGPQRVRSLDSETVVERPAEVMAASADLFGLDLGEERCKAIAESDTFTRHSKFGGRFDATDRRAAQEAEDKLHADEVEKVAVWAEEVARSIGVPLEGPAPLLGG